MAERDATQAREEAKASLHGQDASPDKVLDALTQRITDRLRAEIRQEVVREAKGMAQEEHGVRVRVQEFLSREVESHTCPICYELLAPPDHIPMLLFPCGHTFCEPCLASHKRASYRNTCPYCRTKIASMAPNRSLQSVIASFTSAASDVAADASDASTATLASLAQCEDVHQRPRQSVEQRVASGAGAPEHRTSALAYLRQYRTLKMRANVLENEHRDCATEATEAQQRVEAVHHVLDALAEEEAAAKQRLAAAQEEYDLVLRERQRQDEALRQSKAELQSLSQRQSIIMRTLAPLHDECDKVRLLIESLVPDVAIDEIDEDAEAEDQPGT